MIVDELEAAAHQLVSAAKYLAALRRISRPSSSSFTRARSCRFSFSIAVASTAPGRGGLLGVPHPRTQPLVGDAHVLGHRRVRPTQAGVVHRDAIGSELR